MLHPASVSHLVTNGTIWAIIEVYEPVQSQDADGRMCILLAFVFVFVPAVAKFWNYLINRRLRGDWWLLAKGFYDQFFSMALATASLISNANLVVCSPILFCHLSCSCDLRRTLNAFVKIKSILSPVILMQFLQHNFFLNTRYSIGYVASSFAFLSSVVPTSIHFHAK
jgi:hypothetical protein